jgi:hypothetical protein
MDVKRNGDATNDFTNATTLQSAHELHSDGRRDMTAITLWGMRELHNDGKKQCNERRVAGWSTMVL